VRTEDVGQLVAVICEFFRLIRRPPYAMKRKVNEHITPREETRLHQQTEPARILRQDVVLERRPDDLYGPTKLHGQMYGHRAKTVFCLLASAALSFATQGDTQCSDVSDG
jgi:hypothetical protein